MFLYYILVLILFQPISGWEHMIQRACQTHPEMTFCRPHIKTSKIRTESEKKEDVFLRWAYMAAKDSIDIEKDDTDIEELETNRKKPNNVMEYCSKYSENFKSYCTNGNLEKLEGLLAQFCNSYLKNCEVDTKKISFPTPRPLLKETSEAASGVVSECEKMSEQYAKECTREGFTSDLFCGEYRRKCGKIDGETARKVMTTKEKEKEEGVGEGMGGGGGQVEGEDSLELPEEFEQKEKEKELEEGKEGIGKDGGGDEVVEKKEEMTPNEVTTYCTNYIENYNFYCIGDMLPEHSKFCDSYKKNCPDRLPLKQSGSFLGSEGGDTESSGSSDKTYLYKGSRKEYCNKFSVNYEYYCKGNIENVEIFTKFCPSYKKACVTDKPPPANPFTASKGNKKISTKSRHSEEEGEEFPDFNHPSSGTSHGGRKKKVIKRRACTADCDQAEYPHCTTECKCDYAYPAVQKFCNPPPLPLFLNTCRLWYNGCPKYEQYHYASQFIYSKAEKGKVLEGPKLQTTFNLLSPSGETLPYKPARRYRRDSGFVYWPDNDNDNNKIVEREVSKLIEPPEWVINNQSAPDYDNDNTTDTLIKVINVNGNSIELVPGPPLPKKSLNRDEVTSDKKKLENAPNLPRNKKTTGGESVPVFSDSVFTNALTQYNSLTDSRGILHRPRSRSPFTKPGLWEPNPDDPHNRDHANKYWYHPESVNVDWLQGQLAWGAHFAVPAAGVGGTDGFSAVHFPSIGTFLNIPDDYD